MEVYAGRNHLKRMIFALDILYLHVQRQDIKMMMIRLMPYHSLQIILKSQGRYAFLLCRMLRSVTSELPEPSFHVDR